MTFVIISTLILASGPGPRFTCNHAVYVPQRKYIAVQLRKLIFIEQSRVLEKCAQRGIFGLLRVEATADWRKTANETLSGRTNQCVCDGLLI